MKSIIYRLIALLCLINLVSCSCAIDHTVYKAKSGSKITEASFRAAAESTGLKARKSDSNTYQKRSVSLTYSPNDRIIMHSSFCPTPLTLLTWGADARAWDERCNKIKAGIEGWYSKRGITLEHVQLSTLATEAQQAAPSNP